MARAFFHFLGSIHFALILIALAALTAILGTFLESFADSHGYASYYTYESIFFTSLLCGFFVNILVSALRRFPFKLRHIPFLITHLGLLMIIAGQLIKKQHGIQGTLALIEGKGSNEIIQPNTYALLVEMKDPINRQTHLKHLYELPKGLSRYTTLQAALTSEFSKLKITILNSALNTEDRISTWIKGGYLSILGQTPIKMENEPATLDFTAKLKLIDQSWQAKAMHTSDFLKSAADLYKEHTHLLIKESSSNALIGKYPLKAFLKEGIETPWGKIFGKLHLQLDLLNQVSKSTLDIEVNKQNQTERIEISLHGPLASTNTNAMPWLGKSSLTFDIAADPSLVFMQNLNEELLLFGWSEYGEILSRRLSKSADMTLIAYDDGFMGYTTEVKIPLQRSREQLENKQMQDLSKHLNTIIPKDLSWPLKLLYDSCKKCDLDFGKTTCDYLLAWNNQGGWLYKSKDPCDENIQKVINAIAWETVPKSIYYGCHYTVKLFESLSKELQAGEHLHSLLKNKGYPLSLLTSEDMTGKKLWQKITHHMFAIAHEYPEITLSGTPDTDFQSKLLSAYFRAHDVHLSEMARERDQSQLQLQLETTVIPNHVAVESHRKIESEIPAVLLSVEYDNHRELISLAYDKHMSALKWPILGGKFAIRFQPMLEEIPHRLRLREARQITYPDTQQPYSYEGDLLIREHNQDTEIEKTLSMNVVHETSDGYRFYLANISPLDAGSLKRVQIVVNKDPAKYILTYPGSLVTVLGIVLLFWLQPYSRRDG